MKFYLLPAIALLIVSLSANAQDKGDTTLANQYYSIGDSLFFKADYMESVNYYGRAAAIYEDAELWDKQIKCFNQIAQGYTNSYEYDTAINIANSAISIGLEKLENAHPEIANCYNTLGLIAYYTNDVEKAYDQFKSAAEIRKGLIGDENLKQTATLYNNMAIMQLYMLNYDRAIELNEMALEIRLKLFGELHYHTFSSFGNLSRVYTDKMELKRATEYGLRSIAIGEELFDDDHPSLAISYTNQGIIHELLTEHEKAREYFFKALKIDMQTKNGQHTGAAQVLEDIGATYLNQGDYEQALEYTKRAIDIFKKVAPNTEFSATAYANAGNIYRKTENWTEAIKNHEKALEIRQNEFGDKNQKVAISYSQLSDDYYAMDDLNKALRFQQKALIANYPDFQDTSIYSNPTSNNFIDENALLFSLEQKALLLFKKYQQDKELADLETSLETYMLCDEIIDNNRQARIRHEDKLEVAKISKLIFNESVKVCNELFVLKKDTAYQSMAFYFAEKSKASTLLESLTDSKAKKFSGLPEEILKMELDLKSSQSYYKALLQQFKTSDEGYDTIEFNRYQSKYYDINFKLDSINELLESKYSNYYQFKYQNNILTPEQVSQRLEANQVLIEYFDDENNIYVFVMTRDYFLTHSFAKDSIFTEALERYIGTFNSIEASRNFEQTFSIFSESSFKLYRAILSPIIEELPSEIDHLILVPTDKLAYVPLEMLITNAADLERNDYKSLDYVFKKYSMSYAYSASLYLKDQYRNATTNRSVLAFAPSYQSDDKTYANLRSTFRDEILPLKWNEQEIQKIGQYFDGAYKSGPEATEGSFKNSAKDHGIFHLAMHAFVDDEDPMQSKLLFFQDNDSLEDGMLHTYELFNMDLSAEMVVLSACKTGLGKLQVGEGIMSLGRAFSYAGCPSIVTSHWSVDDQSTSELMASFYKYIADGMSKDKALRQAKLDFLSNTNGPKTHPYYWGGFVVLGDTKPLSEKTNYTFIILAVFMVIIPVVVWWYMRDAKAA